MKVFVQGVKVAGHVAVVIMVDSSARSLGCVVLLMSFLLSRPLLPLGHVVAHMHASFHGKSLLLTRKFVVGMSQASNSVHVEVAFQDALLEMVWDGPVPPRLLGGVLHSSRLLRRGRHLGDGLGAVVGCGRARRRVGVSEEGATARAGAFSAGSKLLRPVEALVWASGRREHVRRGSCGLCGACLRAAGPSVGGGGGGTANRGWR